MIQTSKRDNNYFSLSNNITNLTGQAGVDWPNPLNFNPENPQQYDAILKICDNSCNVNLQNVDISQGREAACDINNHTHDIVINGIFGQTGQVGQQVLTVKGGSYNIEYEGIMKSRGQRWDGRLGDWSDQSCNATYNVDMSKLRHEDNNKIRWVVGRAKWPTKQQLGQYNKILFWYSIGEKIYWWLKWILIKIILKMVS